MLQALHTGSPDKQEGQLAQDAIVPLALTCLLHTMLVNQCSLSNLLSQNKQNKDLWDRSWEIREPARSIGQWQHHQPIQTARQQACGLHQ